MKKNYCLLMAMLFMGLTNVFGQVDTWDGNISNSLTKEGTTYLIQSAADLAFLAQEVNKGTAEYAKGVYKLTTDIDLNKNQWSIIGNNSLPSNASTFQGKFDGNNHVISNLYHKDLETPGGVGLFGTTRGATINNLSINQAEIDIAHPNAYKGAVAILVGAFNVNSKLNKCSVSNATIKIGSRVQKVAILIGSLYNGGTVENCYVINSTIKGTSEVAAGFIGDVGQFTSNVKFNNCYTKNIKFEGILTNKGLFTGNLGNPNTNHTGTISCNNCYAEAFEEIPFCIKNPKATITEFEQPKTIAEMIRSTTQFSYPFLGWNLNTNGGLHSNTAIWSHNGQHPVFADANNYPTYKIEKTTIYRGENSSTTNYTLSSNKDITAIVLGATQTTTDLPQDSLINFGTPNCLKYIGTLNYTGKNVIKDGESPSIELTDGAPFHCPIEINNANINYTRSFLEGWNTICLPFAFATTADDADKVEKLVSGTTESVRFEYVTNGTEANTPYLINIKSAGEKTFSATGVSIPTSASLNNTVAGGYTFQGIMMASDLTEGYGLVLDTKTQEVMFKKIPVAGYPITPFRAYLTGTATPSNAPLRVIHGDGGATNLGNDTAEETFRIFAGEGCVHITSGKARNVKMFSIDGRLSKSIQLNEGTNTISGVHQGIYLINNQKVVVK